MWRYECRCYCPLLTLLMGMHCHGNYKWQKQCLCLICKCIAHFCSNNENQHDVNPPCAMSCGHGYCVPHKALKVQRIYLINDFKVIHTLHTKRKSKEFHRAFSISSSIFILNCKQWPNSFCTLEERIKEFSSSSGVCFRRFVLFKWW